MKELFSINHNKNRCWFLQPVEVYTKCGRHGRIKEPVGTHGIVFFFYLPKLLRDWIPLSSHAGFHYGASDDLNDVCMWYLFVVWW